MKFVDKEKKTNQSELKEMASNSFDNLVKAVVDITAEIMVVDAEMHSDQEQYLLEKGYKQKDIWGINIYPDAEEDKRVEFDSMINLRPSQGNRSRGIDNPEIREKIIKIVNNLVDWNE